MRHMFDTLTDCAGSGLIEKLQQCHMIRSLDRVSFVRCAHGSIESTMGRPVRFKASRRAAKRTLESMAYEAQLSLLTKSYTHVCAAHDDFYKYMSKFRDTPLPKLRTSGRQLSHDTAAQGPRRTLHHSRPHRCRTVMIASLLDCLRTTSSPTKLTFMPILWR
jgi:hypothetical protein